MFRSDSRLHAPFNGGGKLPERLATTWSAASRPTPRRLRAHHGPERRRHRKVWSSSTTARYLPKAGRPPGRLPSTCTTPRTLTVRVRRPYTETVQVSGDGADKRLNSSRAPTSGTWSWTAVYSGDDNNNSVSSGCSQETVSVNKAAPTFTTSPSAGGTVGAVTLNDTATLKGGMSATGSITFNLYAPSPDGCTGTPAFTQMIPSQATGPTPPPQASWPTRPGRGNWTANYAGDAMNNAA